MKARMYAKKEGVGTSLLHSERISTLFFSDSRTTVSTADILDDG